MSEPENPPAFPPAIAVSASGDEYHGCDGMTLRDYFAGQVLPIILTRLFSWADRANIQQLAASAAYDVADAMLAERSK